MEYDLPLKIAEFKINGFALFENLISPNKTDELCAAFMPLLEHVQTRETKIGQEEVGDLRTGKGRMVLKSRFTLNWPLDPPFLDPELYANPVILDFLEKYWGTENFHITCLHSNNPSPGSTTQNWHRDTQLLTPGIGNPHHPHFGVKIPLVDTNEKNGSIEVLPCTQYLAEADFEGSYDEFLIRDDFELHSRRLNMSKGTFWVQDPRTLHRGTPNTSMESRPELVICYSLSWFRINRPVEIHKESFDQLTERGKQLFSRAKIL